VPGREADHTPPSSAEVKNAVRYTSNPQYVFMTWCLIKQRIRLQGVVKQMNNYKLFEGDSTPLFSCVRHLFTGESRTVEYLEACHVYVG